MRLSSDTSCQPTHHRWYAHLTAWWPPDAKGAKEEIFDRLLSSSARVLAKCSAHLTREIAMEQIIGRIAQANNFGFDWILTDLSVAGMQEVPRQQMNLNSMVRTSSTNWFLWFRSWRQKDVSKLDSSNQTPFRSYCSTGIAPPTVAKYFTKKQCVNLQFENANWPDRLKAQGAHRLLAFSDCMRSCGRDTETSSCALRRCALSTRGACCSRRLKRSWVSLLTDAANCTSRFTSHGSYILWPGTSRSEKNLKEHQIEEKCDFVLPVAVSWVMLGHSSQPRMPDLLSIPMGTHGALSSGEKNLWELYLQSCGVNGWHTSFMQAPYLQNDDVPSQKLPPQANSCSSSRKNFWKWHLWLCDKKCMRRKDRSIELCSLREKWSREEVSSGIRLGLLSDSHQTQHAGTCFHDGRNSETVHHRLMVRARQQWSFLERQRSLLGEATFKNRTNESENCVYLGHKLIFWGQGACAPMTLWIRSKVRWRKVSARGKCTWILNHVHCAKSLLEQSTSS